MRTIGLIGGMSFESSAVYYRLINEAVRRRLGKLHSADLILQSVDFQEILDFQYADRWDLTANRLVRAAAQLEAAGAECVLICANTMHFIADDVSEAISVPLIHIIDETAKQLLTSGCRRPLLLATRFTMEQGFYSERMARFGVEICIPETAGRAVVQSIIFDELCAGVVKDSSRQSLIEQIALAQQAFGADAVILGCTELGLILDPDAMPLPTFDTAIIHTDAAVAFSFDQEPQGTLKTASAISA